MHPLVGMEALSEFDEAWFNDLEGGDAPATSLPPPPQTFRLLPSP